MLNKDARGKIDRNLGKRPIPFTALFIGKLTCRFSPTCFWHEASLTSSLLQKSDGWVTDLVFPEIKTCCAYLYLSGLIDMVHWYTQSRMTIKSILKTMLSSIFTVLIISLTLREVLLKNELKWEFQDWNELILESCFFFFSRWQYVELH